MNAKNAKREIVMCTKCGSAIKKEVPREGAIERALNKLKREVNFGIKEKNETN
jgi:Fe2+ or Zn2+ uptake regulation protein